MQKRYQEKAYRMQMHIFLAPATLLRLLLESLPLHTPNNQVQSILHRVDE